MLFIPAAELLPGDHIVGVMGLVLDAAPDAASDLIKVTYSPHDRDTVLVGYWGPTEKVQVIRDDRR